MVVVYDAPVLPYYASHDGNGKNEALLKIQEAGTSDRLYTKRFGGSGL